MMIAVAFVFAEAWGWYIWGLLVIAIIAGIFLLAALFFVPVYGKLWIQAYMSRADIRFLSLIGMHFRQLNPNCQQCHPQDGFEPVSRSEMKGTREHYDGQLE